jgi:lipoprotein-releasing system ATP-binding protein
MTDRGSDVPGAGTGGAVPDGLAVVVRTLFKSYPTPEGELPILMGLDLNVRRGEIVAITGESGAGKSTLLHLLGGLDRPTGGQIIVDGVDLNSRSDAELARFRNRQIGFVFQFHHLLPDFTAVENVMVPRLIAGAKPAEAERAARELLRAVELQNRLHHRPSELSGGEQQRVAVARALANSPAVVLADEPSGNLDYRHSGQLHDLMWRLVDERGTTFVIATHDRALAARADREIRLENGLARELPQDAVTSYFKDRDVPGRS